MKRRRSNGFKVKRAFREAESEKEAGINQSKVNKEDDH
jgi:hypothetical protein